MSRPHTWGGPHRGDGHFPTPLPAVICSHLLHSVRNPSWDTKCPRSALKPVPCHLGFSTNCPESGESACLPRGTTFRRSVVFAPGRGERRNLPGVFMVPKKERFVATGMSGNPGTRTALLVEFAGSVRADRGGEPLPFPDAAGESGARAELRSGAGAGRAETPRGDTRCPEPPPGPRECMARSPADGAGDVTPDNPRSSGGPRCCGWPTAVRTGRGVLVAAGHGVGRTHSRCILDKPARCSVSSGPRRPVAGRPTGFYTAGPRGLVLGGGHVHRRGWDQAKETCRLFSHDAFREKPVCSSLPLSELIGLPHAAVLHGHKPPDPCPHQRACLQEPRARKHVETRLTVPLCFGFEKGCRGQR